MIPQLLLTAGAIYSVISARSKGKKSGASVIPSVQAQDSQEIAIKVKPNLINETHEKDEETIKANHYLKVSLALLGCTVGGMFYPPILLGTTVLLVYMSIPFWQSAYHVTIKERRVNMSILDAIVLPSYVLFHFYFLGSLAHFFYFYSRKILLQTEDRTRKSLVNTFGQHPRKVWIIQNGIELEIPFDELTRDCLLVVRAGEMIAADGIILEGNGTVDQHILTGESQPVEKSVNDEVFASTVVLSGNLQIRVECTGQETSVAQIGEILLKTADYRTSVQSRGEKIADNSAFPTLLIGILAVPISGISGAIAVLNSSIGYNVRIFAPVSILNYLRIASRQGVLVKDGRSLELLTQVDTIVFDKTGTLTLEQPHVGKIHSLSSLDENTLLQYAATAEYKQTHPIAKAILIEAQQRGLDVMENNESDYEIGYGIKVNLADRRLIRVGSLRFMQMEQLIVSAEIENIVDEAHAQGNSIVVVAIDQQLVGLLELYPTIRPEAKNLIDGLHQLGLTIYIISGDHTQPTANLAHKLGIDNYFAETLPADKAQHIEALQKAGKKVCFVGDGINDSIALKKANVSVSIRGASTIAIDTAQIVLMDNSLEQLIHLFELSTNLESNLKNGFRISIIPGLLCVSGVFLMGFGLFSSILFFNLGMLAGGVNAVLPVLQNDSLDESKRDQA